MLNLRYHVVSLVAVFLALGIGVVMGSTVISKVTVDQLNKRQDSLEASVRNTRHDNDQLAAQLRTWERFADQGRTRMLVGQLRNIPVLVVGVQGIDRKPVDALRSQLLVAGANLEGTVWLNDKLNLHSQGDTNALAAALG
ncbi:MAG: hypothetical protein JWP02_1833, partial [Acidimicrobiales bacterium]|nr:hypothetical protein [Acidimicrobiales bacterium]